MVEVIIGFILGLIATAFGALLNHKLSEIKDQRNRFEKAGETFRAAFTELLMKLDESNSFEVSTTHNFVHKLLVDTYEEVNKAQIKFRHYLNHSELMQFDDAWKDYCGKENKYSEEFKYYDLVPYDTDGFPQPQLRDVTRRLALKRIERLLGFTKPRESCWHITTACMRRRGPCRS
jgi:hypothetical protein